MSLSKCRHSRCRPRGSLFSRDPPFILNEALETDGYEAQGCVAPAPLLVSWVAAVSGVRVSVATEPRAAPDVREKADVDFKLVSLNIVEPSA